MEQKLSSLDIGQNAIITSVEKGGMSSHLQDLGFTPGSWVSAELASPLGGEPIAYRIRGTLVALRRTVADGITVSMQPKEEM